MTATGRGGTVLTLSVLVPRRLALNSNDRPHHMARHRATKQLRALGEATWHKAGRPRLGRASLTTTISYPDRRTHDADNYALTVKGLIDGIINPAYGDGLLPDDSDQWLVGRRYVGAHTLAPRGFFLFHLTFQDALTTEQSAEGSPA